MFFLNIKNMDWGINGAIGLLGIMSVAIISSIASDLIWQQIISFSIMWGCIIVMTQVDWRPLVNYRWVIYGIYGCAVLLLTLTFFFAPTIRETRSWLVVGQIQFQTAEFAKIALIIFLSYFYAQRHVVIAHWYALLLPMMYVMILAGFVLVQPDLGSALVLFGIGGGFLLVSGMRWRHIFIGIIIIVLLGVGGWAGLLKDYQKERIIGVFNTEYDPLGINYSAIQSKIAIGSSGWLGKGYKQGTQVQLGFLPEASNDFIFAAFVEEWGMIGATVLLGILLYLMMRIVSIGMRSKNNFSKFITLGGVTMIALHIAVNIGSNTGLLPVIGLPLPFISHGGSHIIVLGMLIGLVQSIVVHDRH